MQIIVISMLQCLKFISRYINLWNFSYILKRLTKGMVTAMDDAVGMVIEELKRTHLFENTIIVFTADVCIEKAYSKL